MADYPFAALVTAPSGAAGGALAGTYPNPSLGSAALLAEPSWLPSDPSLLAWSYDPAIAAASTGPVSGTVNLIRVNVRSGFSCTNVCYSIGAIGVTLTAGQNFAGLYNSSGTLIGTSADQAAAWAATTGLYQTVLSGGPFALTAGFYWVALLSNGTTPPTFLRSSNQAASFTNSGLSAASSRYGAGAVTQTALPASFVPSAITPGAIAYWAGLS